MNGFTLEQHAKMAEKTKEIDQDVSEMFWEIKGNYPDNDPAFAHLRMLRDAMFHFTERMEKIMADEYGATGAKNTYWKVT